MGILSKQQIEEGLQQLNVSGAPIWELVEGYLRVTYQFENFSQAFSWMTEVAFKAEAINHHPNWHNCYRQVEVALITHDKNAITHLDFELAIFMQKSFCLRLNK